MSPATGDAGRWPRQAVILAGGRARRLGALARETPKPLLPVGGSPFIEYLLDEFARFGFAEILLACGRLGGQFIERYHECDWKGARVTCHCEPREGGTAGALWLLREHLQESFALANGDTLFDLDWLHLAGALQANDAGVIALKRMPAARATRYGAVRLDTQTDNGRITDFAKRPEDGIAGELLINGGAYVLQRQVLEGACELPLSLEREVLPHLVRERRLRGVVFSGELIDIGVPQDYERAQMLVRRMVKRAAFLWDARHGEYPPAQQARQLAAKGAFFLWTTPQQLTETQRSRSELRTACGIRVDGIITAQNFAEAQRRLRTDWPLLGEAQAVPARR